MTIPQANQTSLQHKKHRTESLRMSTDAFLITQQQDLAAAQFSEMNSNSLHYCCYLRTFVKHNNQKNQTQNQIQ